MVLLGPPLKSCRSIDRMTLVPWAWATDTRPVRAEEFQVVQPASFWLIVPSHRMFRPKYATVLRRLKDQLGYPYVGSARLALPKAKPNTSLWRGPLATAGRRSAGRELEAETDRVSCVAALAGAEVAPSESDKASVAET